MEIVGVNSTTGRAVKCIDPSMTTKSESSWLGYSLCGTALHMLTLCVTRTHFFLFFLTHLPLLLVSFTENNAGYSQRKSHLF